MTIKFNVCKKIDLDYFKDYLFDYEMEFDEKILAVLVGHEIYDALSSQLENDDTFCGFQIALVPSLPYGDVKLVISEK